MSQGNGQSMKCKCGGDLDAVTDSRARLHKELGQVVARRRRCSTCGEKTATFEVPEALIEHIRRNLAKEMMAKLLEGYL